MTALSRKCYFLGKYMGKKCMYGKQGYDDQMMIKCDFVSVAEKDKLHLEQNSIGLWNHP